MRNLLLLSAALLSLAAPGAFAQGTGGNTQSTITPGPDGGKPGDAMAMSKSMPTTDSKTPMSGTMPMSGKMPMSGRMMHEHRRMMMSHMSKTSDAGDIRPGHEPGVGDSYPASDKASNITAGDSRSTIAPRLPTPMGGANASPAMLLGDAQKALDARQSGRAQEALERAETAMLQRSVPADQAMQPAMGGGVAQVQMARAALAKGDMAAAKKAIAAAMAAG